MDIRRMMGVREIKVTEEVIRRIKIFQHIRENTAAALMQMLQCKSIKKGEMLFWEQEETDRIYFIESGKINIFKTTEEGQRRVIYILYEGAVVNEEILERDKSIISAEGFEDAVLFSITKAQLFELMEGDFALTKAVMLSMAEKMRRLYRQLKNSVAKRIDRKVAAKLLKLSKEYGKEIEEGIMIDLNITITYLAEMLGHQRETVSRAVKQLEQQGLITYKDKRIVVKREKLLEFHKSM